MSALGAAREEIGSYYSTLFMRADAGGYVSLRSFEHDPDRPPVEIRAVQINGEGLASVIAQATGGANRAASYPRPVVFAPPPCTFTNSRHAAEADLHNGLALVAECDSSPTEARVRLRGLLGAATIVAESGGLWVDPETGEVQPKLHIYYRLAEPTRSASEHVTLKRGNRIIAALTGSDPSATSLVHPLARIGRSTPAWRTAMSDRLTRFRQSAQPANGASGANGTAIDPQKDKDYETNRNKLSLFIGMDGLSPPYADECACSDSSISSDSNPGAPCAECGRGSYYRAPGECWRCSACEPAALPPAHEQAGWAFCSVPGGVPIARDAVPYPSGWRRPDFIYLDRIMPDPETAPIGKCAGCRFTAPLTAEGLCGRCTWERAT